MEIQVSGFASRSDLETEVRRLTDKAGASIVGTKQELARLGLSCKTSIYGVSCTETDYQEPEPVPDAVPRGPIQAFGLNGQKKNTDGSVITEDSGEELITNDSSDDTEPSPAPETAPAEG